ncbi:MAG: fumarate hydratase [Deltaproteobacteria bacterium]|nr:MAG: fumarate hydratase [Deltaproteobacteria bacterium]
MREVDVSLITDAVKRMSMEANTRLGDDVIATYAACAEREESETGKSILEQLQRNAAISGETGLPLCQDTGVAVVFIELGQEVHLTGGELKEAVNEGVRRGYREGYLRKSIVADPLRRKNTGDNTPAVLHVDVVPGDKVKITIATKGGGSENMSGIKMLKPADGVEGVKDYVVERVREAGPNPCPPTIVGVGIGGTFEVAAILSKKALLRPLGKRHADPFYAALEEELLEKINRLGIGPMGLGGSTTSFDVKVEVHPCHIASLPVAVNIQCHSTRHLETEI